MLFEIYETIKAQTLTKLATESSGAVESNVDTPRSADEECDEDEMKSPADMLREIEEAEILAREKIRAQHPEFRRSRPHLQVT